MKKNCLFITLLVFVSEIIFSQNLRTERIVILNPDKENLNSSESVWLAGAVRDRLEANFAEYTNFVLVDSQNEPKIKALQKKSENAAFDESTAIEIGKLKIAEYAVFSTIRKLGKTYSLTCNFTNLTTGEKKTALASGKTTTDELFNMQGCAADEITMKLCEQIGIKLTASQKYILQHGENDLSYEEELKLLKKDEENFKKQLSDFDIQIKNLSRSTDLSDSAKKAKIEAERAIIEQKLKASEEKTKRLLEEEKRKKQDKEKDAERSSEQKRRRDEMSKEAEAKVQAVKKELLKSSSIFSQINTVETKKKALAEIYANVDQRISEENNILQQELQEKINEIENRPYRKAETENGNPTKVAKNNRKKEINKLKLEYKNRMDKISKDIKNATKPSENTLLDEIESDCKILAKPQTISSLTSNLKYSFGDYSGKTASWEISLYLYSDGLPISQQNINLKYSELTGKSKIPNPSNEEEWNNYLDEVDLYDSLFHRGNPILTFEVDVEVHSTADIYSSKYSIEFKNLKIKTTLDDKIISKPNLTTKKISKDFSSSNNVLKKSINKMALEKKVEVHNNFDQSAGNGGMTELKVSVNFNEDGYAGFKGQANFALSPYFFVGANIEAAKTYEFLKDFVSEDYIPKFEANIGINWRPKIFHYPPNFYVMCGLGGIYTKTVETWTDKSSGQSYDTAGYVIIEPSFGIEIPIATGFLLFGQGNVICVLDAGTTFDFEVGLSVNASKIVFSKLFKK